MPGIEGITVILHERIITGKDPFGNPTFEERLEEIENVLVVPSSSVAVTESTNVEEAKVEYTLAIPKGDTHEWTGCIVEFFGQRFKAITIPVQGIDELIPLDWNKKVQVERYE